MEIVERPILRLIQTQLIGVGRCTSSLLTLRIYDVGLLLLVFGLPTRLRTVGHESIAKWTQQLVHIFAVPDAIDALVVKEVTATVQHQTVLVVVGAEGGAQTKAAVRLAHILRADIGRLEATHQLVVFARKHVVGQFERRAQY